VSTQDCVAHSKFSLPARATPQARTASIPVAGHGCSSTKKPLIHVQYTAGRDARSMGSLRALLLQRGFEILQDRIGKTGRELIVRSPEGRVMILCAATDNPWRDLSVVEEILYGDLKLMERGPLIGLSLPWPHEWHGY
jgi:hypothetical protein